MPHMRELCSGRTPQNVVLCRMRLDPVAAIGGQRGVAVGPNDFKCPPNVPVFTTEAGLRSITDSRRGRSDNGLIPVIANINANIVANTLIFVGISYNAGTKSRPIISVATGGSMPIAHTYGAGGRPLDGLLAAVWWQRSDEPYASEDGPTIAVPVPADGGYNQGMFKLPTARAVCGISILDPTPMDCALQLGVPPLE